MFSNDNEYANDQQHDQDVYDVIETNENGNKDSSDQPHYERTLRYHVDTITQIVFNPNK